MPKQQKNGLTFYVQTTLMPEMKRQGRVFPNGMRDIMPMASQRYKSLPAEEKQRYERMAKEYKAQAQKLPNLEMRDNVGNLIVDRKDPAELMIQKRKEDRLALMHGFPAGDALLEEKFYLVGFEYMVELEDVGDNPEFLPCEVGLVEWSMRGGILRSYHKMINPGQIPLGYRFKCMEHGEDTHKIPLEEIARGDENYRGIWLQMMNFVNGDIKYLYCMEHEYAKIDGCLKWMRQHSVNGPNVFRVRFLEDLVSELYSRMGRNVAESFIRDRLTSSTFDYEPNTSCIWHQENESKYCALAFAKRYSMILSDTLSTVYDFDLTPNHLPARNVAPPNYIITGPNQEQLVPDFSKKLPAGRGCTVDDTPGRFGGRDIRYASNQKPVDQESSVYNDADSDDDYDDDDERSNAESLRASQSQPSMSSYARFANRTLNAPMANQLPAPAFTSDAAGIDVASRQLSDFAVSSSPPTAGRLPLAGRGCGSPARCQPALVPPAAFTSPGRNQAAQPAAASGYVQMMPSAVNQFKQPVLFDSGPQDDGLASASSLELEFESRINEPAMMTGYPQQLPRPAAAMQPSQKSNTCPGSLQAFGRGKFEMPRQPTRDAGIAFNGGRGMIREAGDGIGRGVGVRPPPGFVGGRGSALYLD